jgi:hypothetical protein
LKEWRCLAGLRQDTFFNLKQTGNKPLNHLGQNKPFHKYIPNKALFYCIGVVLNSIVSTKRHVAPTTSFSETLNVAITSKPEMFCHRDGKTSFENAKGDKPSNPRLQNYGHSTLAFYKHKPGKNIFGTLHRPTDRGNVQWRLQNGILLN